MILVTLASFPLSRVLSLFHCSILIANAKLVVQVIGPTPGKTTQEKGGSVWSEQINCSGQDSGAWMFVCHVLVVVGPRNLAHQLNLSSAHGTLLR